MQGPNLATSALSPNHQVPMSSSAFHRACDELNFVLGVVTQNLELSQQVSDVAVRIRQRSLLS